jgi:hypothetical protein
MFTSIAQIVIAAIAFGSLVAVVRWLITLPNHPTD